MIDLNRRRLVGSLLTLICAPAIVRASSLMAVKSWRERAEIFDFIGYHYIVEGKDQYGNHISEIIRAKNVFDIISKREYGYGITIKPIRELDYV